MAGGNAGHTVAGQKIMMVAGLGCRRGATADEIGAALAMALSTYADGGDIALVATEHSKAEEPGIVETAHRLSVRLVALSAADLEAVEGRLITRSEHVRQIKGVPSIAEASALAAA